jgi:dTDP-4-dehydrorhamnose 3,5-epimerase-like enzyme
VPAWCARGVATKYLTATYGAFVVGCVRINDWENPSADLKNSRWVMNDKKPSVLWIPPGHANGFMSLTDGGRLTFFSTATLDESLGDDVRFPAHMWDAWTVEER